MQIFVSHDQVDVAIYTKFCRDLDRSNVRRWDGKHMAAGQPLADQLRQAIRVCDACVFLAYGATIRMRGARQSR